MSETVCENCGYCQCISCLKWEHWVLLKGDECGRCENACGDEAMHDCPEYVYSLN